LLSAAFAPGRPPQVDPILAAAAPELTPEDITEIEAEN
jgi:hypothetical protein